jgi:hypothetical protein
VRRVDQRQQIQHPGDRRIQRSDFPASAVRDAQRINVPGGDSGYDRDRPGQHLPDKPWLLQNRGDTECIRRVDHAHAADQDAHREHRQHGQTDNHGSGSLTQQPITGARNDPGAQRRQWRRRINNSMSGFHKFNSNGEELFTAKTLRSAKKYKDILPQMKIRWTQMNSIENLRLLSYLCPSAFISVAIILFSHCFASRLNLRALTPAR